MKLRESEAGALRLAADGFRNVEIAHALAIRESSVRNLLHIASQKLGAHNRLCLVLLAHHAGLVDLGASAGRYAARLAA